MGRAKLKMELISNVKGRRSTFVKRKKGLKKKAYELSTLCDVDLCMIIYNPKEMEQPMEPEIWPSNPYEISHMIESYRKRSEQDRSYRTLDLSYFFKDRTKKVEEILMKLRKRNDNETKYPSWDDRYNNLPVENLRELSHIMESKLDAAKTRLEFLKANQSLEVMPPGVIDCTPIQATHNHNSYFMQDMFRRNNMHLKLNHEQQSIRDLDVPLPYYPFDHTQKGLIPVDPNSIPNPMMMMMMNDSYCTQLGGASSSNVVYAPMDGRHRPIYGGASSSHVVYPPMEGPMYVDPLAGGMVENMMVNNPRPTPMHYYSPSMQVMPPYIRYPMMPTTSSQVHASQLEQYYELADFQMKNQK